MFTAAVFCQTLSYFGSTFFTGVPDSLLRELCTFLNSSASSCRHLQAENEGGAIGLASGNYLATGAIPVVYMQNSGLGNAVNPLLSLADPEVYGLPMLLLIGLRGDPSGKDEPQHMKQGRVTPALLEAMSIPYGVVTPDWPSAEREITKAYAAMRQTSGPYALIFKKGCFSPEPSQPPPERTATDITRKEAIRTFIEQASRTTVFVASTGLAGRELYDLREERGESHERDFLNVGAMGHASMIALGIALSQPDRRVVCLDGDGALLMHLGSLSIVGQASPKNFTHVLLNNGIHDSVGGQKNPASWIELHHVAASCGYKQLFKVLIRDGMSEMAKHSLSVPGPAFISVPLVTPAQPAPGRPSEPFSAASRQFRDFLSST